jgi:hypothetical protein
MAGVSVDIGEITATYRYSDVPVEKWPELVKKRHWHCQVKLTADCRNVSMFVREAEGMWEALGYASADDMIANGYGLDPSEIRLIAEWLEMNAPEEATPLRAVQDAVKHARQNPLLAHGEIGQGRGNRADNISSIQHGTEQTYTLRRLARDNPELLDRVASGELSANSAAVLAGFRRPTKTVPIDSPRSAIRALLRVFSAEDLAKALAEEVG